jgi:hypothetical protein
MFGLSRFKKPISAGREKSAAVWWREDRFEPRVDSVR